MRQLLVLILVLFGVGVPGSMAWSQTGPYPDPEVTGCLWERRSGYPKIHKDDPPKVTKGIAWTGCYSEVDVYAFPNRCGGTGLAFDALWDNEAGIVGVAEGYYLDVWEVAAGSDCHGRATLDMALEISGNVDLINPDCAGAALGYVRVESNIMNEPLYVALTQSAGETVPGTLGSGTMGIGIAYVGLGVSLTPTVGTQAISYPEVVREPGFARKCVDTFYVKTKTRAYLRLWANDWAIPPFIAWSEVHGALHGAVKQLSVTLDQCP
jgi:hypothetical protein